MFEALLQLISDGSLAKHSFISLRRLLIGFTLGSAIGFLLGVVVAISPLAYRIISPTINFISPVPVTSWIPLIIILTGIGELSKSTVLAVGCFFPVFYGTVSGFQSATNELLELAQFYGKTKSKLIKTILLPSAMPALFQALQVALGLSWILLVVAEVIASREGLGWLMWDSRNFGRPDEMIVGMIAAGVLGATTLRILRIFEHKAMFWK